MYYYTQLQQMPIVTMAGNSVCTPGWSLQERVSADYELIYVVEGELFCSEDGEEHRLQADSCMMCRPVERQAFRMGESTRTRFFYMHLSFPQGLQRIDVQTLRARYLDHRICMEIPGEEYAFCHLPESASPLSFPPVTDVRGEADAFRGLFERCFYERDHLTCLSQGRVSLIVSEMLLLLTKLCCANLGLLHTDRVNVDWPQVMTDILAYIEEDITQELQIKDIAARFRISPQYLIRLFHKSLNQTPLTYISEARVKLAKQYMRNTDMTIAEIAYAVGVNDPSYFSRLFKNREGVTPSVFKAGVNSKNNQ